MEITGSFPQNNNKIHYKMDKKMDKLRLPSLGGFLGFYSFLLLRLGLLYTALLWPD